MERRSVMRRICLALALAVLVLVPSMASAQATQINFTEYVQMDWWLESSVFPCLTEVIYLTGLLEVRTHVVVNPHGGYSWQISKKTQEMTAVGLDTGETYRYSGPMSYIENGWTDEPWVTLYPLHWTFHNINHFVGPGDLPEFYQRTLVHINYDRETGEATVDVERYDILCR